MPFQSPSLEIVNSGKVKLRNQYVYKNSAADSDTWPCSETNSKIPKEFSRDWHSHLWFLDENTFFHIWGNSFHSPPPASLPRALKSLLHWFQHVDWNEMGTTHSFQMGYKTKQIKASVQKVPTLWLQPNYAILRKRNQKAEFIETAPPNQFVLSAKRNY